MSRVWLSSRTCIPISEDAILIWDGEGMGYLESRWIEVSEGDIVYAPATVQTWYRVPQGSTEDDARSRLCLPAPV